MSIKYPGQLNRALTCSELDNNFAEFINRSNHVGTQPASSISDLEDAIKNFNTIIDLKSCCLDLTNRVDVIEATVDIQTILNLFQNQYDEFVNNIDTALSNSTLINSLSSDIINIQLNISNLFNTSNSLQDQIDTVNTDIDNLETQVAALSGTGGSLGTRVTAAENDIDALETLTGGSVTSLANNITPGILVRGNGNDVLSRSIVVNTDDIALVNGDGLAGNIEIELSETGVTPGTYNQAEISVDSKGRIVEVTSGSSLNQIAIVYSDFASTFAENTWVTYPLDRVVQTDNFLSLNTTSDTFTLASGTYLLSMYVAIYILDDGDYNYRLFDVTTGATAIDAGGFDIVSPSIVCATTNSNTNSRPNGNNNYILNSDGTNEFRIEVDANSAGGTVNFGGTRGLQLTLNKIG